jgi:phage/plasmid-associated DNA primase
MTEALTINHKLRLLSKAVKMKLASGEFSDKGVKEFYSELHDLINPNQDHGISNNQDNVPTTPGEEEPLRPWRLACTNGEIDLKSGDFHNATDTRELKHICPVDWLGWPGRCLLWRQTLLDCFAGDQARVDRFQRECGSALIGAFHESKIIVLQGSGRNGKSLIFRTLEQVMGSYSRFFDTDLFHAGSTFNPYDLCGLRMAFLNGECHDSDQAMIKFLCGGEFLSGLNPTANHNVTFRPSHTFFLETNSLQGPFADDPGILSRLRIFPMKTLFLETEELHYGERRADPHLQEKLSKELPGILAWLVEGCLAWQKESGLISNDWEDVNKAFLHLFDTTRSFIELAEPVHNDECLVNTDNIKDLEAAYQDVHRLLSLDQQAGVA